MNVIPKNENGENCRKQTTVKGYYIDDVGEQMNDIPIGNETRMNQKRGNVQRVQQGPSYSRHFSRFQQECMYTNDHSRF